MALATRAEVRAAVEVCRHLEVRYLVVHLGLAAERASDETRALARRSLETIREMVHPLGVQLAVEVIPNDLSTPASLVRLLEEADLPGVGVCLDVGHAFLHGDVLDAIEALSGHVVTTHVHDNHGRHDEHLVPFDGGIDWSAALIALQKVGYDGTMVMELGATGPSGAVLERGRRARRQMERLLTA